ncbi:hypothetical protein EZS27_024068 [termite gut metagenome]|uniref:H repeat-associated protein N-terminal domain-containing protein n=1 Tax=termite gut metagenome TaxID=433724 RepID=A0A5J4R1N2_9ZZZZ
METTLSYYFSGVEDPQVQGSSQHLLSDILPAALTYLTGGVNYQDMHLFAKERGKHLQGLLHLPNGAPLQIHLKEFSN